MRKALTALGTVPVPRGEFRATQAALDTALAVLKNGKAFGIHPEGSRSRDGRLYRGRVGVAWLALASGAPVVPVGLIGAEKMMPVGGWLPRRVPVTVRLGKPMYFAAPAGPLGKARRDITDEVMAAIRDLSGQEMAGEFNGLVRQRPIVSANHGPPTPECANRVRPDPQPQGADTSMGVDVERCGGNSRSRRDGRSSSGTDDLSGTTPIRVAHT